MKTIALFLFSILLTLSAIAQPNQYGEFQRAIASQRSSAAYLEAIADKARTPNIPYTATGVDRSLFYTKQVTNPYALTDEQKQSLEQWRENEKKQAERRSEIMDSWRAGKAPYASKFEMVGFSPIEADKIANKMVNSYGHTRPEMAETIRVADYKLYFDSKKATASFDELMLTISEYEYFAPGTAYFDLQSLKTRFPEKAMELEVDGLNNLLRFFQDITELDSRDSFTFSIIDEYFRLADQYPQIEKDFLSKVKHRSRVAFDPYEIKLFYCAHYYPPDKKKVKEVKKLQATLLKRYAALGY